jgi:hypothetical protein
VPIRRLSVNPVTGTPFSPYGWSGTVSDFLAVPKTGWLAALQEHYRRSMGSPAGQDQVTGWEREHGLLGNELKQLVQARPAFDESTLIFDYDPPRPRGWHPDLIILAATVWVVVFRSDEQVLQAHADQLEAFTADLRRYHAGAPDSAVVPVLVHTRAKDLIVRDGSVIILSPNRIADFLTVESDVETGTSIDAAAWIAAGYSPASPADR